jgi:hypothetical protein
VDEFDRHEVLPEFIVVKALESADILPFGDGPVLAGSRRRQSTEVIVLPPTAPFVWTLRTAGVFFGALYFRV